MNRTLQKTVGLNPVLLSFLLGAAGALAIFLPFLVVDKGFFLYCGDYNSQQIPFYLYVQQFIKEGGGTWSWATDLGSSIVSSYSFYNIGSPFLWLTMLFPSRWMPFLMVPLFMLKFGANAAAACLYFKRYAKSRNFLVICSVLFAFCGFNVYNTFFNHMLDPVCLFALMLWALDEFVYEGRRGLFALFVGLALLDNYFFFIGNVVFVLLYFVVKVAMGDYRIDLKRFGLLAFEAVLGVGIGMVLALPSLYVLLENPRTMSYSNGFGMVMYGSVQQYFNIITSLFLPPDPPYLPNLFTEGAIKWTSMSAFLPIVSVAGVIAYCKAKKRTALKTILGICLVMAMVPILNSSFYAFNWSYYARWFYMPILLMCLMTLRSLEDEDIDLVYGARWALILTGLYVIFGLLPTKKEGAYVLGAEANAPKFWLTYLTAMLAVGIFYVLVRFFRNKPRFAPMLLAAVMGFSVFYAVAHIALGKFPQWTADSDYRAEMYDGSAELTLPDIADGFYRIDAYNMHDNFGLWKNQSCLQTFQSVVTPTIMEFYPMVGVKRDVSSKPERRYYALRGLLNVRYTVVPLDQRENFEAAMGEAEYQGNLGWHFVREEGALALYENENYLPLGFTYDHYIWMEHLMMANEFDRSALLVRAMGLDYDQVVKYGYLFDREEGERIEPGPENTSGVARFEYDTVSYDHYTEDVAARRREASYVSSADSSGFRCNIVLEKDNLVFFAVPYDPGFTATVNGVPAEVLNVSGGMMAVPAPAGDNEIVVSFHTRGFSAGIVITLLSVGVLAGYMVFVAWWRKTKPAAAEADNQGPVKDRADKLGNGKNEDAASGGKSTAKPARPADRETRKPGRKT